MRWASPSAMAVLPTPGRADERRVVLAMPEQDVDDARDFLLPAAHRLEASGAGVGRQVARESRQHAARGFVSKEVSNHVREAGRGKRGSVSGRD